MTHGMNTSALLLGLALLGDAGTARAWTGKVDLISPNTCTLSNGRLFDCKIVSRTLSGALADTAVPLRTMVKVVKKGDCSTQYPLEVSLTANSEPAVKLYYLKTPEATLRGKAGRGISKVKVIDTSKWTKNLNVASSCRISLIIASAEPDVSSKADAQELLKDLEKKLDAKQAEAEYYKHLVQYRRAFTFLQTVAESFHGELTNELVQQLRSGAEGALSSLSMLSSECDAEMDDGDRQNIMLLLMSLPQLGSAEDWVNPDGSTKSLADFIGPEAQAVYLTVDKLAQETETASGSAYDEGLRKASEQASALEYQLALAKQQLAAWL